MHPTHVGGLKKRHARYTPISYNAAYNCGISELDSFENARYLQDADSRFSCSLLLFRCVHDFIACTTLTLTTEQPEPQSFTSVPSPGS